MPGGGGTYFVASLNCTPAKPVGVQFPITMRPPDFVTRLSSEATRSGRGANMAPKIEITRSKEPSGNSSFSASPSWKRAFTPSASARRRACSTRLAAMSTPITSAPRRAAGMAELPVPHATSSTFVPGRMPSEPTKSSSICSTVRAMTPKSPAIQVARRRALRASMSDCVVLIGTPRVVLWCVHEFRPNRPATLTPARSKSLQESRRRSPEHRKAAHDAATVDAQTRDVEPGRGGLASLVQAVPGPHLVAGAPDARRHQAAHALAAQVEQIERDDRRLRQGIAQRHSAARGRGPRRAKLDARAARRRHARRARVHDAPDLARVVGEAHALPAIPQRAIAADHPVAHFVEAGSPIGRVGLSRLRRGEGPRGARSLQAAQEPVVVLVEEVVADVRGGKVRARGRAAW